MTWIWNFKRKTVWPALTLLIYAIYRMINFHWRKLKIKGFKQTLSETLRLMFTTTVRWKAALWVFKLLLVSVSYVSICRRRRRHPPHPHRHNNTFTPPLQSSSLSVKVFCVDTLVEFTIRVLKLGNQCMFVANTVFHFNFIL